MNILDGMVHNPPKEKQANCDIHGAYLSKCYMRNIWLGCPECSHQEKAKAEAEQKAHDDRVRLQKWTAKIERAGIPPRFQDRTFGNYNATTPEQRAAKTFARDYAENFEQVRQIGRCALFLGLPGTGKTHLACAIGMHAMLEHRAKVLFTSVMRAVRSVKDSWVKGSQQSETQAIEALVFPDLLILDEVGVQFGSEFEKNIIFDVLNERYELRKPTILLSNLTRDQVRDYVGERVMDRIREDGGAVVAFAWGVTEGLHMHEVRQGHLYSHDGRRVLVLATGHLLRVPVLVLDESTPWTQRVIVDAHELIALPMRYFQGRRRMPNDRLELHLHNRQQAWHVIKSQLFPFLQTVMHNGGRWVLTVTRRKRTNQQNRRYWGNGVLKQIAEQATSGGRLYDPEVWHEQFKRQFIGIIELPNGQVIGMSSKDLDTAAFCKFCDQVEAYAATELGVTFYDLQPREDA